MRVLVLTSPPPPEPRPDTDDTEIQAEEIADCLRELGHEPTIVPFALPHLVAALDGFDPHLVFNLVEDVPEGPDEVYRAAEYTDLRGFPHTGASAKALRRLGRKPGMKAMLSDAGLPVPPGLGQADPDTRYIIKSVTEHASIGLDASSVVTGTGAAVIKLAEREHSQGGEWFAEAYIDGREFNVALLERAQGVDVLPIAEILFKEHVGDAPKIVGYAEKWDTESPAYRNTPRAFPEREEPLFAELERLSLAAWELFGLTGYARVDFRVDRDGHPFILEINANPCLAADAGFCAAASQMGLTQTDVVARIIEIVPQ